MEKEEGKVIKANTCSLISPVPQTQTLTVLLPWLADKLSPKKN